MRNPTTLHRSLDPQDWSEHRRLGHQMIDDMIDWLSAAPKHPTWTPPSQHVLADLREDLSQNATPAAQVYEDFKQKILPYPTGNVHPRFWSHVIGSGTIMGALAEFLAASMNCNVFGGHQIACHVETEVLRWLGALLGYPEKASGLLLSGGSMANLIGLSIALRSQGGPMMREQGLKNLEKRFCFYCSSETHNSLVKAAEFLGLGRCALHSIPVDGNFRISLAQLKKTITEDRQNGWTPFCIIGNAVSVGTGSIDPLKELAELCAQENLWFHVDGAIGALACITPELQGQLQALSQADSIAFDLHKWLHIPYEAGCLMVRDPDKHREAFANSTAYLAVLEGGFSSGPAWPNQLGPELSRGFKALKVWMSFKEQGLDAFSEAMSANIAQAAYLADLIRKDPRLELLAPVVSNIVNFRYHPATITDETALNRLNRQLLITLQESGHSVPSHNNIHGHFALRVAISNHRTKPEDLASLVSEVCRLGDQFTSTPPRAPDQVWSGLPVLMPCD